MLIIRLNSDGSFDDTFGNQGVVTLAPSDYERALCIVIQPDGKYLIGGNSNFKSCVIRLKENGDYDTTFANNGRYTTDLNSSFSVIESLQFQSDGKIIAGGFRFGDSGYTEYALIRLTREGILDTVGFGVNGIATYDSGTNDNRDLLKKIVVLPNDNILAAGEGGIARFTKDGNLDSTFGINGAINSPVLDLAVQADGKLVAPAYSPDTVILNFRIARFNVDGTPDYGFAIQGLTNTDFDSHPDGAVLVAIQPDQKILAAGMTRFDFGTHYMLVRYLSGLELAASDFSTNPISALVYPNPISDQATLQITLDQPAQVAVQLLDMNGQLIENCLNRENWMAGKQQKEISVPNNLPPGIYLLKVQADDKSALIKVVKN
jgi:uncharacterized delta-60 repeat protein